MTTYNIGDKVIANQDSAGTLHKGDVYTIKHFKRDMHTGATRGFYLQEVPGWWLTWRFDPAEYKYDPTQMGDRDDDL